MVGSEDKVLKLFDLRLTMNDLVSMGSTCECIIACVCTCVVSMYACMYVCSKYVWYVCMYVCMYVCKGSKSLEQEKLDRTFTCSHR